MSLYAIATRMAREVAKSLVPNKLPLYVERRLLNPEPLARWLVQNGYPKGEIDKLSTLHCTLCYSTNPVNWSAFEPKTDQRTVQGTVGVEQFGESNVLLLPPRTFAADHARFISGGASYDFPQYRPHVTVGKGLSADRWKTFPAYTGRLEFGPELFDQIKD